MTATDLPLAELRDGRGLLLRDIRLLFPNRVAEWPAWMQRREIDLEDEPYCARDLKEEWTNCARCGVSRFAAGVRSIDLAHIFGAAKRIDHRTNVLPLCSLWNGDGCHEWFHNRRENMAEMLRLKVTFDREGTCWLTETLICGHWLDSYEERA